MQLSNPFRKKSIEELEKELTIEKQKTSNLNKRINIEDEIKKNKKEQFDKSMLGKLTNKTIKAIKDYDKKGKRWKKGKKGKKAYDYNDF